MKVLGELAAVNDVFGSKHDENYFSEHATGQKPQITLLTCADSRVQLQTLMDDPINRIFCVRNGGNQMAASQGSIDYGIRHLQTPVMIILGHPDCGAIKTTMRDYSSLSDAIQHELDLLSAGLEKYDGQGDFDEAVLANVQRNIDYQVDQAVERYADLVKSGNLTVLGMYYDFQNSLGEGYGRLLLGNLNGETDLDKIREMPGLDGVRLARYKN